MLYNGDLEESLQYLSGLLDEFHVFTRIYVKNDVLEW